MDFTKMFNALRVKELNDPDIVLSKITHVRSFFVFQIFAFFQNGRQKNTKITIFISVLLKISIWRPNVHLNGQEIK